MVADAWKKRDDMVKSSGCYHLFCALWPTAPMHTQLRAKASKELGALVGRQCDKWTRFSQAIGLPVEYSTGPENKATEFTMMAQEQLNRHITGSSTSIQLAKDHFHKASQKIEVYPNNILTPSHLPSLPKATFLGGEQLPTRKRKKEKRVGIFNTDMYWGTIAAEVPELYAVYRLARTTCASEGGCERVFSSEALVHNQVRNSLSATTTELVLKIRWNWEPIRQLAWAAGILKDDSFGEEECQSHDIRFDS